jgi:hypothetical protein
MITDISQNEILESFSRLIPILPALFEDDFAFTIGNTEKFLKVVSGKNLDLGMQEGAPLPKGSAVHTAVVEKRVVSKSVPKEVFGVPLRAVGFPVKNERGEVVGVIGIGRSLDRQNEILNISSHLSSSLEQMTQVISQISIGVQAVSNSNDDILTNVEEANNDAKNTDAILSFVKDVANKTNLLGLNASIEAARAGEAGKGFSVVAQEIRKLSNSSNESIKRINDVIKNIRTSIEKISVNVNSTGTIFQEQAASLEEVNASMQELSSTAQLLERLASKF